MLRNRSSDTQVMCTHYAFKWHSHHPSEFSESLFVLHFSIILPNISLFPYYSGRMTAYVPREVWLLNEVMHEKCSLMPRAMVWIWDAPAASNTAEHLVFIWEVLQTLGSRASLEEVSQWESALQCCVWSPGLLPVCYDVNMLLFPMFPQPWLFCCTWVEKCKAKWPWAEPSETIS